MYNSEESSLNIINPMYNYGEPSHKRINPMYNSEEPSHKRSNPMYNSEEPSLNIINPMYNYGEPSHKRINPMYNSEEPSHKRINPMYNSEDPSHNIINPMYNSGEPSHKRSNPMYNSEEPSYKRSNPMYNSEEPSYKRSNPMYNSEEPSHKRSKAHTSPSVLCPDLCLPYDLVINFMSRLSRLEYAALSLTAKRYRSLVASPDLYSMRSLMGRSETYTYVCLRSPLDHTKPQWFILRHSKTLDSSDLIPIPSHPSLPEEASSVVVLDWGIYVIGGLVEGIRTSDVWLLDCRTHTWCQAPSMYMHRAYGAAGVVDGKIYVIGGCLFDKFYSYNWGEVFDPTTQTWEFLPRLPDETKHDGRITDCVVRDKKIYAVDATCRTLYYSPSEGKWGRGNRGQIMGNRRDWCMIDNLICNISKNGTIRWSESNELDGREREGMMDANDVKGLDYLKRSLSCSRVVHFGKRLIKRWEQDKIKLGKTPETKPGTSPKLEDLLPGARLSHSNGNMLLFWDVIEDDHFKIWCAEISLEKRQGGEVWGNIKWSNAIMTNQVLNRFKVLYSASVTL